MSYEPSVSRQTQWLLTGHPSETSCGGSNLKARQRLVHLDARFRSFCHTLVLIIHLFFGCFEYGAIVSEFPAVHTAVLHHLPEAHLSLNSMTMTAAAPTITAVVGSVHAEHDEELFDTYDEAGHPMGTELRAVVHARGIWHHAVYVFVFNSQGQLLMQQRAAGKKVFPGRWDLSVVREPGTGACSYRWHTRSSHG